MPSRKQRCKRGHALRAAYLRPDGKGRECRTCRTIRFRHKQRNSPRPTARMVLALASRFRKYVRRRGRRQCWSWTGARARKTGYGIFRVGYRCVHAHVAAFIISRKRLPRGIVCHDCDNTRCCNPRHVYDGTNATNARDRVDRGRTATGRRSGAYTQPHRIAVGERASNAKLTDKQVIQLRRIYARGGTTGAALGRQFRISAVHARNIIKGRRFPWLKGKSSPWRKWS